MDNKKLLAILLLLIFGFGIFNSSLAYGLDWNGERNEIIPVNDLNIGAISNKKTNTPFIITENSQNTLTNVTIENTLDLRNTAEVIIENTTIWTLRLTEYSRAYIYNSTIDKLITYDEAKVVIEDSLIKTIQANGLADLTITNCTVSNSISMDQYITATITESNLTLVEDFYTTSVLITNSYIWTYSSTLEIDTSPQDTQIINSTIVEIQTYLPDYSYTAIPNINVKTSNVSTYSSGVVFQGLGEVFENETNMGSWNYSISMDEYTLNSIVNFTPNVYLFYDNWTLNNITLPTSLQEIQFLQSNVTLYNTNLSVPVIVFESQINILNTQSNFEYLELDTSILHFDYSIVNGTMELYYSMATISNSEIEKLLSYSKSNVTITNTNATQIMHNPASSSGHMDLNNVTLVKFEVKYDSVNLYNVNVIGELFVEAYLPLSNFSNVNTSLLKMYIYIYDDVNLTETGFHLLPSDTSSLVELPNTTYTTFQIVKIVVGQGAVFRITNVYDISYTIYGDTATVIMDNVSVSSGVLTMTSVNLIINNTNIQVTSPNYFTSYYSTMTIMNSTVKWFTLRSGSVNIVNSVITASSFAYDSTVSAVNSTIGTSSGSSFVSYNSKLNFTNVILPYYLRTVILTTQNIMIETYLNNVSIGATYTETLLVNGTANVVFADTGTSGTFYNSTKQANNVTVGAKKYNIHVFDNGTLKLFNLTSDYTETLDYFYGHDNATIQLENTSLSININAYDRTNVIFNNSQMMTYKNVFLYGYAVLQAIPEFPSSFYGIYGKNYAKILLTNATIAQSIWANDYTTVNLTNPSFSGSSSNYVYFNSHSSGIIKSDKINTTSTISITVYSDSKNVHIENQRIFSLTTDAFNNLTVIGCDIDYLSNGVNIPSTNITELSTLVNQLINTNVSTFYNHKNIVTQQTIQNSSGIFSVSPVLGDTIFENVSIGTFTYNATWVLENGTLMGYNTTVFSVYIYTGVISPIPNIVASPLELEMEEGNNLSIQWTLRDFKPQKYYIYENGTQIKYGYYSQIATITVDLSVIPTGIYNFTILAENGYGNSNTSTIMVIILPSTPPQITSAPVNASYESGLFVELYWMASDLSPSIYEVYVNGTKKDTGTWVNNTSVVYNVSELVAGTYNITIVFWDEVGNYNKTSTFVTVLSLQKPVVTYLNSTTQITMYDNETIVLSWKAEDASPNQYTIYVNGTSVQTAAWESGDILSYEFSGTAGSYNVTISFSDKLGLNSSHTVILTVLQSETGGSEEQPSTDYTWIIIVVVVVVIAGAIAVYLLKIKKVSVAK